MDSSINWHEIFKGKVEQFSERYLPEILRNSQSFKIKIENNHKFTFPDYWKSRNEHHETVKITETSRCDYKLGHYFFTFSNFIAWATDHLDYYEFDCQNSSLRVSCNLGDDDLKECLCVCPNTSLLCVLIHVLLDVLCWQVFWREHITCSGHYENSNISTRNTISRGPQTPKFTDIRKVMGSI